MNELATVATETVPPMSEIGGLDGYLKAYGGILGRKAVHALDPLHVPQRDGLPDFSAMLREPFEAQGHVIAAAVKMFDEVGSGFVCGTMGTGKTLIGMLAVHYHASRSRRQGGSGGKYRAIIICPDHLIGKWVREIEETIPGAIAKRFGPQGETEDDDKPKKKRKKGKPKKDTNSKATLRDVIALLDKAEPNGRYWEEPEGAEWYVLGRNQSKWLSDWTGIADPRGSKEYGVSSRSQVVDTIEAQDEFGRPIYDKGGRPVKKSVLGRVHYCPSCGATITDGNGSPLAAKDLRSGKKCSQKQCNNTYLQQLPATPEQKPYALDRIAIPPDIGTVGTKIGQEVRWAGKRWKVTLCGEPLYNYTARPYRWSPAKIIQKKCRGLFKYLIIDESHEFKSDSSGQSMAASKLIGAVDHVIALTGTIIGGYANHLYPLLMRITPRSLRAEGFEWGKDMEFSEKYGKIDLIVTTKETPADDEVTGSMKSMRRAKSGSRAARKAVRPGVMPTMFGNHMIGASIFITLDEMSSELPNLNEYVGSSDSEPPPPPETDDEDVLAEYEEMADGWFNTACDMEPEQGAEYRRVMAELAAENRALLQRRSTKLLGATLWTGLDYPDKPFGWGHDPDYIKAVEEARAKGEDVAELEHTVGYWDKPGDRSIDNFVGVVTPADCPKDRIYPKEQVLIDICKKQKADGRQTWVYVQMTGVRDVRKRLAGLLEAEGLKVGILDSNAVEPIEREEWIASHGRNYDVMISHPQLVSTGLDLFSKKQGGHNYSTLVFYQTGYNLFTMRQAARRAWRIGQPLDCRVYYLYYKETMQHKAMSLMSKKMAAAQALEGEFSEEGLAAMAGEDNVQMALAKNLSERIDDADVQRTWNKVKSGAKKPAKKPSTKKKPPGTALAVMGSSIPPNHLDTLPAELQLIADLLLKAEQEAEARKPKPDPEKAAGVLRLSLHDPEEEEAVEEEAVEEFEYDPTFDEEYDPSEGDFEVSEEILARLFANVAASGWTP